MRRIVIAAGALALVSAASFTASADSPTKLYPNAGCNTYADAAGDASVVGSVGLSPDNPSGVGFTVGTDPSSKDFDITGVSYRLSDDVFTTVVRVPGLQTRGTGRGTGDTWISRFTVGKHAVEITVGRVGTAGTVNDVWDTFNPLEYVNSTTVDGIDARKAIPGAEFDAVRGLVFIQVDRAQLEALIKAPLETIGALEVEADTRVAYSVTGITALDLATAPAKQTLYAGENRCFL